MWHARTYTCNEIYVYHEWNTWTNLIHMQLTPWLLTKYLFPPGNFWETHFLQSVSKTFCHVFCYLQSCHWRWTILRDTYLCKKEDWKDAEFQACLPTWPIPLKNNAWCHFVVNCFTIPPSKTPLCKGNHCRGRHYHKQIRICHCKAMPSWVTLTH